MNEYVGLAIFSVFLSSFSQVLLKKESIKVHQSMLGEYINWPVLFGYGIMIFCIFLMMIAYKGLPYKCGPIIESIGYVFIMLFGRYFFKVKITWNCLTGNLIIVIGVIVFSM